MDIKADYTFDAPIAKVWEAMLDPDRLAACMPGCEQLTPIGDDQFEAVLKMGVGPVTGTYEAKITLTDKEPTSSFKMIVEGSGAPGFVRGEARINLEAQGAKTLVKIEGEAQVGGTVARVGQRLIGTVNKMMMDRFFTCLMESPNLKS
jgi:carbon monoxide dehydrogenase subunit G